MAATAAVVVSICGFALAVAAWTRGWYLAGYLGGAACGDLFIWSALVLVALWLPRRRGLAL